LSFKLLDLVRSHSIGKICKIVRLIQSEGIPLVHLKGSQFDIFLRKGETHHFKVFDVEMLRLLKQEALNGLLLVNYIKKCDRQFVVLLHIQGEIEVRVIPGQVLLHVTPLLLNGNSSQSSSFVFLD
jgi:hypothetical protein